MEPVLPDRVVSEHDDIDCGGLDAHGALLPDGTSRAVLLAAAAEFGTHGTQRNAMEPPLQ